MNNVEIDLSKNENSLILISEFFDILEAYEQNGKTTKKIMFLLLQKMKELNNKYDSTEIVNGISDLFSFIKENLNEEDLAILLIKLLIKEARKKKEENKFYTELLKLIFSRDISDYSFKFLLANLSPFIDEILGNEFFKCLEFYNNIRRDDILVTFENSNFSSSFQVIKENMKNINVEEMILFYLETKIMNILDTSFREEEYCNNDNVKYYYLEYFLNYLERNRNNIRDNNDLVKLLSIAYIKCYYSKLINYICKNYIEHNDRVFELLHEGNVNQFKISMMLYILKLVYGNINNVNDLEFGNNNSLNVFNRIRETIKEQGYFDFEKVLKNKNSGFDFIIMPIRNKQIFFEAIDAILQIKKNCLNQDKYDENLISNINKLNNIDLLYCALLNIVFSLYYQNYAHEDNKKIIKWLNEMINKNEIHILKDNEILTKIFKLFINEEFNFLGINARRISYQQLLCILISFRFVLKIIQFNNEKGLFYNFIINDPKDIFAKNKDIFNLYLKEINIEQRDINYLTYKLIKYIIYSFLYVNNLLEKISSEEVYKMIDHIPKEDEEYYLLDKLLEEFDFIQNELLKTLGIRNIIIFMNSIFDDVSEIIDTIQINMKEKEIKEIEQKIEKSIKNKISEYNQSIEDYFKSINKNNEENEININNNDNKSEEFYDILVEKNSYYNSKGLTRLPYISYLTYTNFCNLDDFKKQYLYFHNDPKSYPLIDCVLKENKIFKVVEFIPKLNNFVNNFYTKFSMNITEEEAKQKITNNSHDINFNEFNGSLNQFLKIYDGEVLNIEISRDSKISEVINSKGNKVFKIYEWIINKYNNFFESFNIYDENKRYIKEVIIQNCTDNDYISFKSNNKSIQGRLKEIICLYSKRNRINNNQELNVYDGGKIIYNFDLIEDMLEKEFILCKRKFSEMQKVFIFSNKIFNDERNQIFIDLNDKYPQEEINNTDITDKLEANLKDDNNLKVIYYNCLYLILYLMIYLKDEKFNVTKTSIDYIIKLMEKENNKISDKFKLLITDKLNINHIFALYEIIEEKAFKYLMKRIKDELEKYEGEEAKEKEFEDIFDKNSLINEKLLVKNITKYIVRYCLGDNNGNNQILKNIKFEDVFKKIDIWGKITFNDAKFKDESNKLCSLNQKENCLLKYIFGIIYKGYFESEEESESKESSEDEFK